MLIFVFNFFVNITIIYFSKKYFFSTITASSMENFQIIRQRTLPAFSSFIQNFTKTQHSSRRRLLITRTLLKTRIYDMASTKLANQKHKEGTITFSYSKNTTNFSKNIRNNIIYSKNKRDSNICNCDVILIRIICFLWFLLIK